MGNGEYCIFLKASQYFNRKMRDATYIFMYMYNEKSIYLKGLQ